MSHGRVKINVPKHRRNTGEVTPYEDLPDLRRRKSDAILLWGTTLVLAAGLLAFGGFLFYQNSQAAVTQPEIIDVGATHPKDLLAQSRQEFIKGDFVHALIHARVGLALEQQKPSDPPLEKDLRRALGLVDLEQRQFGEAVEHFSWLKAHGAASEDLSNLKLAEANYRRVTDDAMEELEGAQQLSINGVQDKAYVKASKAVTSLQKSQGQALQVQAGHLVMANIALRQGLYEEALMHLREAQKLGALTAQQEQMLHRLEAARPDTKNSLASAQMPVVVPRLETGAAYPHGRPGVRPISNATGKKPVLPEQPQMPDIPETASVTPPPRRTPHLELPKLQFPSGQTGGQSGGIPGYQNNNSSNSLPGYNTQTRPRDTLPGY